MNAVFLAIAAVFNALTAWLKLKIKDAAYDLDTKICNDRRSTLEQVAALRAAGTDASNRAADQLLDEFTTRAGAAGAAAVVPAPGAPASGGLASGNP